MAEAYGVWKTIESAPDNPGRQILVKGGMWCGELSRPIPLERAALVYAELSRADWDAGMGYPVCGGGGYVSWVINPTHWADVPPTSEGG